MQPLASGKFFNDLSDSSKDIENFLFPKNLEKKFSFKSKFADFDSDDNEEEEASKMTIDEKIKKFEKQREDLFKGYFCTNIPCRKIILQDSKKIIQNNPEIHLNESFEKLKKEAEANPPASETDYSSLNGQFGSLSSEARENVSESLSSSSKPMKQKKRNQAKPLNVKDVDLQINTSWIQAASLEADEEYLAWLQDLPSTPKKTSKSKRVQAKDDEKLMIDPLEEARQSALAKQIELDDEESQFVEIPIEEAPPAPPTTTQQTPTKAPNSVKKVPTAAEINEEWGFEDNEIGMSIRKFMRGMQGASERKKK